MMLPCGECEYKADFADLGDGFKAYVRHQVASHPATARALRTRMDEEIGAQLIQAALTPRLDTEATDEP
jgi:hypothetical protein